MSLGLGLGFGQSVWLVGACQLQVHSGTVRVFGADLHASARLHCLISPPFDSLMAVEAISVQDTRMKCGSDAVVRLVQDSNSAASGEDFQRAVISFHELPGFEAFLKDYDCGASGLLIEPQSCAVRGACIVRSCDDSGVMTSAPVWSVLDRTGVWEPSRESEDGDSDSDSKEDEIPRQADVHGKSDVLEQEWAEDTTGAVQTDASAEAASGAATAASALHVAALEGSALGSPPATSMPRKRKAVNKCRICSHPLRISQAWTSAIQLICEYTTNARGYSPVVFTVGMKGSGKSTFNRALMNALVSLGPEAKVAYLDLDLGQPEHTPSGLLSLSLVSQPLFTPPHVRCLLSHGCVQDVVGPIGQLPSIPHADVVATRFFGSNTPQLDPDGYIASACGLIDHYRAELGSVPLVINSHGWIKGVGFYVLQSVLAYVRPSHYFYLANPSDGRRTTAHEQVFRTSPPTVEHVLPPWHTLEAPDASSSDSDDLPESDSADAIVKNSDSAGPPRAVRSPAELRSIRLMLYLLSNARAEDYFTEVESVSRRNISDRSVISALRDTSFALQDAFNTIFHKIVTDQREARAPSTGMMSPSFITSSCRAWRVPCDCSHIVSVTSAAISADDNVRQEHQPDQIVGQIVGMCSAPHGLSLPPIHMPCVGLGYVRSIDTAANSFEVVSPLGQAHMEAVNTLVLWSGANDVPAQMLYQASVFGDPYCVPASTIANPFVATAKAGVARKNLGRKRLQTRGR